MSRHEPIGNPEPLGITVQQAAVMLNCSTTHVYALLKRGVLRSFHLGDLCRIDYPHLKAYVATDQPMPRGNNPYGKAGKPKVEATE